MINSQKNKDKMSYQKILLIRTDRIGDVLLTTPAIYAVRKRFPSSHIAVMVRPYTKDIVEGNPYINEVILYDKDNRHKSILSSLYFALWLKRKGFDLAIIFHPTNRTHIITYLAKIPRRIGFDRNFSFLLTDRVTHTKQLGRMHEADYNFELLKLLGIEPEGLHLYMPVEKRTEDFVEALLLENGINKDNELVVLHPGASCYSKIWPPERFAKLADMLIEKFGVKIAIVGSGDGKDLTCAKKLYNIMKNKSVIFAGKFGLKELAALLKKSRLFISNDSGPVHIACALNVPVIAIFGRGQPGLSPNRWGPLGKGSIIIHKDLGCRENCLAHNCPYGFKCLMAISVDEVFDAASSILGR